MTKRRFKIMTSVLVAAGALILTGCMTSPASSRNDTTERVRHTSAATVAKKASSSGSRPNIVVIMTDDMRVNELKYMPNVMRYFNKYGVQMENSFSSNPLCCPARASFLTGQHSTNHKVLSHRPPYGFGSFNDSQTLATALRRGGYKTGFTGKYLNGYGIQNSKVTGRSSRHYVPKGWNQWMPAVDGRDGWGSHFYMKSDINHNGKIKAFPNEYKTNLYGRLARRMVNRFTSGKRKNPFFIYLSHLAPHHGPPADPDDSDTVGGPYRPDYVRGRLANVITHGDGTPGFGIDPEPDVSDKPKHMQKPKMTLRQHADLRNLARQRAESLIVVDDEFQLLVDRLKRRGVFDNTIMIFTSDNGYFQGEHRRMSGKIHAYEPSLRVPLLIGGPGIPNGQKRFDPISTVDLTATILDMAGSPKRLPNKDGVSVLPSIQRGDRGWTRPIIYQGGSNNARRAWFGEHKISSLGVRTARFKYMKHKRGGEEMYDLFTDPLELENLAGKKKHRARLRELRALALSVRDCKRAACAPRLKPSLSMAKAGTVKVRRVQKRAYASRPNR